MLSSPIIPSIQDVSVANLPQVNIPTSTPNTSFSINDFGNILQQSAQETQKQNPFQEVLTPVSSRMRYDDPIFGYNPFNPNQEEEYASRQNVGVAFGKSFIKGVAGFTAAFGEGLIAIPSLIANATNGDLGFDNSITKKLNDLQDTLENLLPVYETKYTKEHPYLSFINPLEFHSFLNRWGDVAKNTGFTAGAIASSLVEDAVIASVTEGIGELPLLPEQATFVVKNLGKIADVTTADSKQVATISKNLFKDAESTKSALEQASNINKAKDSFSQGFKLFNSSLSEAMLEGYGTFSQTKQDLIDQYKQSHDGNLPTTDELEKIDESAKGAGNTSVIANTALLMATNSIAFGSIFKPAKAALKEAEETATSGLLKVADNNIDTFEKITKEPISVFKKAFKGLGEQFSKDETTLKTMASEGFEEGSQYVIQQSTNDYWKRKYNGTESTDQAMSSFSKGLSDTLGTRDGLENVIMGALSGVLIHGGHHIFDKVTGRDAQQTKILESTKKLLESQSLTGLFKDKYDETTNTINIQKDMIDAVSSGDLSKFKNLQHDALFNFVNSGIKANRFDLRIDQLNKLKDLTDDNFKAMFGLDYNSSSKKSANAYVDAVISKAQSIKQSIDLVNEAVAKNPYNYKKDPLNYNSFDNYKEQLAYSLSKVQDNKRRVQSILDTVLTKYPTLDINKAVDLTSREGLEKTSKELEHKINDLKKDEKDAVGDAEIKSTINKEKDFLSKSLSSINKHLNGNVDAEEYKKTFSDLLHYYNSIDNIDENQNKLELDQDVVKTFSDLHDVANLHKVNGDAIKYYNALRTKKGFDGFMEMSKAYINNSVESRIKVGEDGKLKILTSQQVEDEKYQKQQTETENVRKSVEEQNPTVEEISPEEKAQLKEIALKEESGMDLTEEEQKLKEEKPESLAIEKKVIEKTKRLRKINNNLDDEPLDEEEMKKEAEAKEDNIPVKTNSIFSRFNPHIFLNRIFSKDFEDVKHKQNLFNSLFKGNPIENLSDISVEIKETPKDKQVSRKFVPYYENGTQKLFTNLYRETFNIDFIVKNKQGEEIGLIHPFESILFKRDDKFHTLDKMTKEEYSKITGNNEDTYSDFIHEVLLYKGVTDSLKNNLKEGKSKLSKEDLSKLVEVKYSFGSLDLVNRRSEATVINKLNYLGENSFVLSFPYTKSESGQYERSEKPTVISKDGIINYELPEHSELFSFLNDNIDQINNLGTRYVLLNRLPDGTFKKTSILAARPIESGNLEQSGLLQALQSGDVLKANMILKDLYVSDSNNENGKPAKIEMKVQPDGSLRISASNYKTEVKRGGAVELTRDEMIKAGNVNDLIQLIRDKMNTNRGIYGLNIKLKSEDFKMSISPDNITSFDELSSKLTVPVKPNVFKGFNIFIVPHGSSTKLTTEEKVKTSNKSLLSTKKSEKKSDNLFENMEKNTIFAGDENSPQYQKARKLYAYFKDIKDTLKEKGLIELINC